MLDAINTASGGIRQRRRQVVGAGADPVTVVPGTPRDATGEPFHHLDPYDPSGDVWLKTGTLGYYVHRGRVYLQGGVGAYNGNQPQSAIVLTLPLLIAPAAAFAVFVPVDPTNTARPFPAASPGGHWVRFETSGDVVLVATPAGDASPIIDAGWAHFSGTLIFHDISWQIMPGSDPGPSSTTRIQPFVYGNGDIILVHDEDDPVRIGADSNRAHFDGRFTVSEETGSGNLWRANAIPPEVKPGAMDNEATGNLFEIPISVEGHALPWMLYFLGDDFQGDGFGEFQERYLNNVPFFAFSEGPPYLGRWLAGDAARSGDANVFRQADPGPLSSEDLRSENYAIMGELDVPLDWPGYPVGTTDLAAPRVGIFFGWNGNVLEPESTARYYKLVYVRGGGNDGMALVAVDMTFGATQKYRLIGTTSRVMPTIADENGMIRVLRAIRRCNVETITVNGQPQLRINITVQHPNTYSFTAEFRDTNQDFVSSAASFWPGRCGIILYPGAQHDEFEIVDNAWPLWKPGEYADLSDRGYFVQGGREPQVGSVTADVGAGGILTDGPYLVDPHRGPMRNW